jgi:hypothetical protein
MFQSNLWLVLITLTVPPKLAFSSSTTSNIRIQTAAPDSNYCLRCDTDEACKDYATGSICKMGQCTDEDGLFGWNCNCFQHSDCASDRCGGIFQKTCMKRLSNGNMCYSSKGCQSGYCNAFRLCADPPAKGNTVAEDPLAEGPEEFEPEGITTEESEESNIESSEEVTGTLETVAGSDATDIPRCIACNDNSECNVDGICIKGFCADISGVHPITCSTCRGDDDCTEGTFCNGFGLLGRYGKKCAEKRVNGASCSRSQACQSEHCNMLFRCDDITSTKAPAAKQSNNSDYNSLFIWASLAAIMIIFMYGAKALCQRENLQLCFHNDTEIHSRECSGTLDSEDDGRKLDDDDNSDNTSSSSHVEDQLSWSNRCVP